MRLRRWLKYKCQSSQNGRGAGCLSISMTAVSLSPQQYQRMIDRIAGLECMMTNLQSHAKSQQEQIRLAELVTQQLRTAGTPTNPPPPARGTSQKQVTESGAFKSGREMWQWISGTIDEIKASDVFEYRRATDLSTVDMGWLKSKSIARSPRIVRGVHR